MPMLVCDAPNPIEDVKYYTLAGIPGNPRVNKDETGQYGFKHDLGGLAPGDYSIMASACNDFTCSLPSPLAISVPNRPSVPTGLTVISSS